jgi:cysteinyl-tRNA synthetase
MDNMPVHHVNEIAQSEAVNGKKFVNYWYHNEFLTVDGKKMSKSQGSAYTLSDLKEKGYEAMDLRYLYFLVNFRMKQNFTFEALTSARSARLKLKEFVKGEYKDVTVDKENTYYKEFVSALEDSFNMPEAIATVWKLVGDEKVDKDMKVSLIKEFDRALGLRLFEEENIDPETKIKLEELISKRNEAKKNKDYTLSDKIRDEVKGMGYELIDEKDKTRYKKID